MNGYIGLGTKALKICNAVPKPKGMVTSPSSNSTSGTTTTYTTATDYSQYYDPAYWQNYSWQTVRHLLICYIYILLVAFSLRDIMNRVMVK